MHSVPEASLAPMQFISTAFWLFLPTVLVLYWVLQGRLRAQNGLCRQPACRGCGRFLALIAASTAIDFALRRLAVTTAPCPSVAGPVARLQPWHAGVVQYAGFLVDQWVAAWPPSGRRTTRGGHHPASRHQLLHLSDAELQHRRVPADWAPTRDPVARRPRGLLPPVGRRPHRAGRAPAPTTSGPSPVRHGNPDGWRSSAGGVQEGRHIGHRGAPCQRGLRGRRLDRPSDGVGRARLSADLRPAGIRHRDRHGAPLWHPPLLQLPLPVFLPRPRRVPAALARLAQHVVPRLPLHPLGVPASGDCERC